MCVCVCVCVCARAHECVLACVRVCVRGHIFFLQRKNVNDLLITSDGTYPVMFRSQQIESYEFVYHSMVMCVIGVCVCVYMQTHIRA